MSKEAATPKRRYHPEVRRSMILDNAADIVARDGVSSVTMERVCAEAGISKTLIYKYFDGPTALLKELLVRELNTLRKMQISAANEANSFEELVRSSTHVYLNYIGERGLIIERLQGDPAISSLIDPTYHARDAVVDYLAPNISAHFGLPIEMAKAAVDVSFGLPAAAGEYLLRGKMDRQDLEDLTVSMIVGSIQNARNAYLTRNKVWKKSS